MKTRKIFIFTCLIAAIGTYIGIFTLYYNATKGASLDETKLPMRYSGVCIVDRNGETIEESGYVHLEELPKYVPEAFIAMEDKRFYNHKGIDIVRIIGATVTNIKSGKFAEGGSTITCQLVKNTHLNNKKTIKRKLQEAKIAIEIERKYTKKEILEMYLNKVYFGKGFYGLQNASIGYFGKEAKDLSLSETVSLVATIASPSRYSPIIDLEANKRRSGIVLTQMKALGYIATDDAHSAKNDDIIIKYSKLHNNYNEYTRKFIFKEASELLGNTLYGNTQSPIRVETYIEKKLQNYADVTLNTDDEQAEKKVLIAENQTGGIIAYIGSTSPFDSPRQQGSTLKPFIYGAAVETGKLTTMTQFYDMKKSFGNYSPENYNGIYNGWISAEDALSKSSNVVAVEILNKTGIDTCLSYMEQCKITLDARDRHLAIALGGSTYGSTPAELTAAYMTLADQGLTKELTFIKRIQDRFGNILYEHHPQKNRGVSPSSAYIVTEMLKKTVQSGTASQLSYLNIPIAAKTGTVARGNGNSDAWTIGYTTRHTFLCWYGAKDGESMPNNITGGNYPAKTARVILKHLYQDDPPQDFTKPQTVRYVAINTDIKDTFHSIVPASLFEVGKTEKVPITEIFTFDSLDKSDFYLKDLAFSTIGKDLHIDFSRVQGIEYSVFADDRPCVESSGGFITHRKTNAFVKIDILCRYKEKTVFQKSKLIVSY